MASSPRPRPLGDGPPPTADEVLARVAVAVGAAAGPQLFRTLVAELTLALRMDVALVGELQSADGAAEIHTLAVSERGEALDSMRYPLAGTPCEQVIGTGVCSIPSGVAGLFPGDRMLVDLAAESYVGAPLVGNAGPIGLIAVLGRNPLESTAVAEATIRVFAGRAAAELERLRAEAELVALKSFYETVLEHLPLDVAVFDLAGRFEYVNPAAVKDPEMRRWLIGRDEHDYAAHRGLDPGFADRRASWRQKLVELDRPVEFEEALRGKDGVERHFQRMFVPVRGADGRPRQIVGYGVNVTDRAHAERELRASEATYRAMFEKNRAVKLLIDPADGTIVDANPAAAEFYGYPLETLREMRISDINILPIGTIHEHLRDAARERRTDFQFRHRLASGEIRDVEVQTGPLEIHGRQLLFSIVHDVTDRVRAEEALRRSEQYFRSLIHNSLDVVTILAPDGSIRYESPSVEQVLGYSAEERVGRDALEWIHPQDVALFSPILDLQGEVGTFEYRCRHKDGWWRVLESRASYRVDDPVVVGVVLHSRDVTERKRADEAMRKSEEKYRRLFEQSQDAVIIFAPDGLVLDINPAGVVLLGYPAKEDVLALDVFRDVYDEPQEKRRLLKELSSRGFVKEFETRLRGRDGRRITVIGSTSSVRDAEGDVIAYLAVLRDVTLQRGLEDQLRQAQKMEAVGRLAGGLAHDFNNLLTAINGYSELVLYQLPPEDRRRTFVEEIRSAGRRAADLTAKLLTLSRRKVVSPQKVDLNDMVRNLQGILRRLIGEDIELVTRLDFALGTVRVDPGGIEQVLLNLAVNARDAMPTGGRLTIATENVELEASPDVLGPLVERPAGAYVRLTISDSGVGIPPEVQQHVFEPFFTTKEHGKGTGLGLSTVYATVRQSGGHISLESSAERGTTFRIDLPRVDGPAVETRRQSHTAELASGDETVLLVEDDAAVRQLVRQLLEQQGYTVLEAEHAEAAFALLGADATGPDLLVSDVVMPGMSGPELASRLQPRFPEMRILFISGYTDSFIVQHGLSIADHLVLPKPFDADVLARKVRQILDGPRSAVAS